MRIWGKWFMHQKLFNKLHCSRHTFERHLQTVKLSYNGKIGILFLIVSLLDFMHAASHIWNKQTNKQMNNVEASSCC